MKSRGRVRSGVGVEVRVGIRVRVGVVLDDVQSHQQGLHHHINRM